MLDELQTALTEEDDAIHWAREYFPAKRKKMIKDTPWSRIYKLASDDDYAVLKLMPVGLSAAPRVAPMLAQHFPAHVPSVVASDEARGLLLMRDYQGTELSDDSTPEQLQKLVQTYASMQVASVSQPELLENLPAIAPGDLLGNVLEFIRPGATIASVAGASVNADYYLDKKTLNRFHRLLTRRKLLLQRLLVQSDELPTTINHCDLRAHNAVQTRNGSFILYDWDDVVAGPAGLSLHTLFGGCATPAMLLAGDDLGDRQRAHSKGRLLRAYVSALANGDYADIATLERCLPGSILAGALRYLLYYSKYPRDSESYQKTVASKLRRRLGDLLDLCDFLCLASRDDVLAFAHDYQNEQRLGRARDLLNAHLWHNPNDAEAHAALGQTFGRQGKPKLAAKAYRVALQINPKQAEWQNELGAALVQTLEFDQSIARFREAAHLDPSIESVEYNLQRVFELKRAQHEARRDDVVPTLPISAAEYASGRLSPETLALGYRLFAEYGVLGLQNVFDPDLIQRCREQFFNGNYDAYFADEAHRDALKIGDKRFQVTLDVEGSLNDRALYANSFVLPLLRRLLGPRVILGSFTASTALPGADEQWLHKDHRALFASEPEMPSTPPFAVSLMVPLMDLDESVGTTRVMKGSHLASLDEAKTMPYQSPFINVGSTYLMDYRLCHYGMANLSDRVRPIFNITYHRPWFRDDLNFLDQATVRISDVEFSKVPDDLQDSLWRFRI